MRDLLSRKTLAMDPSGWKTLLVNWFHGFLFVCLCLCVCVSHNLIIPKWDTIIKFVAMKQKRRETKKNLFGWQNFRKRKLNGPDRKYKHDAKLK